MTKLELQAIRFLPEEYVRDGTCVTLHMGSVYAIETNLPLIVYRDGVWRHCTAEGEPPVTAVEAYSNLSKSGGFRVAGVGNPNVATDETRESK